MPTDLVWTSTLAEGFELKQFASGLLERGKEILLNDGYNQSAVYVITQTEVQGCRLSFSFIGMLADWPRKGLRIYG